MHLKSDRTRAHEAGLTLIETTVALSILATLSLVLVGSIAQAQRLTNLSRERSVAFDACRSYVEEMRGLTVTAAFNSTRTPADFVPTSTAERLTGVSGEVFKINHEGGTQGRRTLGAAGAGANADAVAFGDGAALGMPRNLTAKKDTTENPAPTGDLVILPARVRLTWQSAVGGTRTATIYTILGGNE